MSAITPLQTATIHYLDSDGKPMAETDVHIRQLVNLRFALLTRYKDDPNT